MKPTRSQPGQPFADGARAFGALLLAVASKPFGRGQTGKRDERRFSFGRSGTFLMLTALLVACTELLHEPASPPATALVLKFPARADAAAVDPQASASTPTAAGDSTSLTGAADASNRGAGTGDAIPRRADGENPGLTVAEVLAEIDEVRVRILRDETVVRDTTVQLAPEGDDTRIRIELDLRADAETLGIAVELLVDGEPAYRDDVLVSVDAEETTEVEVNPKPIPADVRIAETRVELRGIGESVQLAGEVLAVTGEPIEGLESTWETLDPEIVSVTPGGLVTALAEGLARVVGSYGAFSDTVNVSVQRLVEAVVVDPKEVTLVEGETQQFAATLLDSEGNPVSEGSATWTSSAETVAAVDQNGLVSAVSPGEATITAASGGVSDQAEVTVKAGQYQLTVETAGNGTGTVTSEPGGISCGDDCSEAYDDGTRVVLSAMPTNGSSFASWSDCPSASDNTCTVNMTSARTVTATFTTNSYVLTVEPDGNGGGTVTSEPGGISCGDDCSETYEHGTRVVLTATPANGSSFASWTNCPNASGNTCTVNTTAARTITATFTSNSYVLTIEHDGNGTGTITSEPGGISCGDDCSETYQHGTRVVLTARAGSRSSFDSWSNCPSASRNTCTVNMTVARTVTATFAANRYVLMVERNGNGAGTITSEPAGISCGDDCDEAYQHGTRVVLTATPATGSTFSSWRDCPDVVRDTCTVTVTAAHSVTANFAVAQHTLTVEVTGAGRGVVVSDPEGIACPDDCSGTYDHGSVVQLDAFPTQGSTFASWSDCPSPVRNICTVELTAARTVTARFNGPSALFISHPVHGADYTYDGFDSERRLWYSDFTFRGTALDPEDGPLTGESLVWTTDNPVQPSVLGTGEEPEVRLYSSSCSGANHRITLTATNSAGDKRSVFVDIRIWTLC